MTVVSKSTLIENILENFYDVIKSELNESTVTDTSGKTYTLSNFTSSFPDKYIDEKNTYPILVVESPDLETAEQFTLSKEKIPMTITIDFYATNAEVADKFFSKIIDTIETSRDTLADNKINQIKLLSTDKDSFQRKQIKVHLRSVTYSFEFRYTRTRSF